jgi:hypothetical protein
MKKTKTFNAVKSMRRIREQISREIAGMTPKQEIEFFRRKAAKSGVLEATRSRRS